MIKLSLHDHIESTPEIDKWLKSAEKVLNDQCGGDWYSDVVIQACINLAMYGYCAMKDGKIIEIKELYDEI